MAHRQRGGGVHQPKAQALSKQHPNTSSGNLSCHDLRRGDAPHMPVPLLRSRPSSFVAIDRRAKPGPLAARVLMTGSFRVLCIVAVAGRYLRSVKPPPTAPLFHPPTNA